jgi:ferric-dicitrate binding protein FerR (iron transport regulator)
LAEDSSRVHNRRYIFEHNLVKIAAAVVLVVVSGVWFFRGTDTAADGLLTEIPELSTTVMYENETDSSRVYTLPDGSTVALRPSSRLHFNENFSAGNRESRKIVTRVLGTSFLVDAPENGRKVEVQVITGKVSVFQVRPDDPSKSETPSTQKNSTTNGVVLSPNQKVEYYTVENHWVTGLVAEPVPVRAIDEETLSFVFENTPIRTVLEDIQSRFGIELVTENDSICQCTFTGDVSKMTLYDMLDVISNSIGSTYEVKGTRILISGKGCD